MAARPSDARKTDLRELLLGCADWIRRDALENASASGLRRPEFLALCQLTRGATCPADLASALGCSRANVTKLVRRLSDGGYVTEERHWFYARSKILCVTPAGHEAHARAMRGTGPALLLDALERNHEEALRQLLTLMQPSPPPSVEERARSRRFRRRDQFTK